MSVKINSRSVGPGHPCYFVAEIGINHNGSLEMALDLVRVAKEAGAEAVKFQKRTVPLVYQPKDLSAPRTVDKSIIDNAMRRQVIEGVRYEVFPPESLYRLENGGETTNGDLKYALEFGSKEYDIINKVCLELGISWSASAWDGQSAHFINGFEDVHWLKVASPCLTHKDLLQRVRAKGKPVLVSTGGSTMEQVQQAIKILGRENLILLHCVSLYPPRDEDTNLLLMDSLMRAYPEVPVGYSSHSVDIFPPVTAVARGASVIEAHLTLDQNLPGSDHKASLNPNQFADMIKMARRVESMLGDGVKRVLPGEEATMKKLRRVDDLFD